MSQALRAARTILSVAPSQPSAGTVVLVFDASLGSVILVQIRDYIVAVPLSAGLLACPQTLEDRFSVVHAAPGDAAITGNPMGDAVLAHRYSFDGRGAVAEDAMGTAPGRLLNGTVSDRGASILAGGDTQQYVDLPNGIISSLHDATFECWLIWKGGAPWQRILDFGNTEDGEDVASSGRGYVFLTPMSSGEKLRAAFSPDGFLDETAVDARSALPRDTTAHVALVMNDTADRMAVYIDGEASGSGRWSGHLSELEDVNNWLGRSQYRDADLSAELLEFRIYAAALDDSEIQASFVAGPDALPDASK